VEHRRDVGQPTQAARMLISKGNCPFGRFGVRDVAHGFPAVWIRSYDM
jgi:hypothetical protein